MYKLTRSQCRPLLYALALIQVHSTVTSNWGSVTNFSNDFTSLTNNISNFQLPPFFFATAEAEPVVQDGAAYEEDEDDDLDDSYMDNIPGMDSMYSKTLGLTPEEYKTRIKVLFDAITKSNNDAVTRDELLNYAMKVVKVSQKVNSEREFKVLDTDGDGFVSFVEMNALYNTNSGEEQSPDDPSVIEKKFAKDRFNAIDENADGKLTLDEICALLNPGAHPALLEIETSAVMEIQDVDKDGFISFDEYSRRATTNPTEEDLEALRPDFNEYDSDKDGKISTEEIRNVIRNLHAFELKKGIDEVMKFDGKDGRTQITLEEFLDPETGIGISVLTGGGDIIMNPESYPDLELPLKNSVKVDGYPDVDAFDKASMSELLGENGQEKLRDLVNEFESDEKLKAAGKVEHEKTEL